MYISRKIYEDKIYNSLKSVSITILTGPRQVGKTTIMENLRLPKQFYWFNGQNPETATLFASYENLKLFLKNNFDKNLNGIILIDEFQFINDISLMLKLLTDEFKNLQIICTGSSSLEINQKVDESLAGRVRTIPVYILTFEEYLNFTNPDLYDLYNKYESDTKDEVVHSEIKSRYDDYLLYGGLPRIALENRIEEKINLLNDIYQTYLIKDVRNIIETKNIVGFNKLLKLLSSQISSLISINELSVLSGLKYHLVNEFIYLLEQMYILKPLGPYSTNKRNVISKQNKIYFYDTGIRNIVISDFNSMIVRNDNGSIFENSVFNELNIYKDVLSSVYFFRKTNKTKIDFLIEKNNIINAVEVKYKNYKHPSVPRIFYSASDNFYVNKLCIINKNLNTVFNNIKFVQGYLLKKFALKLYEF